MAREHPETGKTRGSSSCALCGARVLVKVNKRGLLYYNCATTDGGCGSQIQPRTRDAELRLAALIEKWNDPEQRRAYLGDAALPAKARKPDAEEPAPVDPPPADGGDRDAADADAPAPDDKQPEDDKHDAPARVARKPRAAPKRTPPPASKPVRLFPRWS